MAHYESVNNQSPKEMLQNAKNWYNAELTPELLKEITLAIKSGDKGRYPSDSECYHGQHKVPFTVAPSGSSISKTRTIFTVWLGINATPVAVVYRNYRAKRYNLRNNAHKIVAIVPPTHRYVTQRLLYKIHSYRF